MKERHFRIMVGVILIIGLYYDMNDLILAILIIMAFEAITNWRIPIMISRLRYRKSDALVSPETSHDADSIFGRFQFEAERMFRILVILFVATGQYLFPEQIWFIPWFVAFALLGAGLSGACPMVLVLRKLGFR
ncbi:MAG: hypothetical protein OEY67_00380 [Gammaproteobacteria bacterium]|nr:hypothetical protein [Gammaproteobacteria bacterium]